MSGYLNVTTSGFNIIGGSYNISGAYGAGLTTAELFKAYYDLPDGTYLDSTISRWLNLQPYVGSNDPAAFSVVIGESNISYGYGSLVIGQDTDNYSGWSIIAGLGNRIYAYQRNYIFGQYNYIGYGDSSSPVYNSAAPSFGNMIMGTLNQINIDSNQIINSTILGEYNTLRGIGGSGGDATSSTLVAGHNIDAQGWASAFFGSYYTIGEGIVATTMVGGHEHVLDGNIFKTFIHGLNQRSEVSSQIDQSVIVGASNVLQTSSYTNSTIIGGYNNTVEGSATSYYNFISGTNNSVKSGGAAFNNIVSGYENDIYSQVWNCIISGSENSAGIKWYTYRSIITGFNNSVNSDASIVGGTDNEIRGGNTFVSGFSNYAGTGITSSDSGFAVTTNGQFNMVAGSLATAFGEMNLIGDYTINGTDTEAGLYGESSLASGVSNIVVARASAAIGVNNTVVTGGIGTLPTITVPQPWKPLVDWDPQTNTLIDGTGTPGDGYIATQIGYVDFATGSGSATDPGGYLQINEGSKVVYDGANWIYYMEPQVYVRGVTTLGLSYDEGTVFKFNENFYVNLITGEELDSPGPSFTEVNKGDYVRFDGSSWSVPGNIPYGDPEMYNRKNWSSYEIDPVYQDLGLGSAAIGIKNTTLSYAQLSIGLGNTALYPYMLAMGIYGRIQGQINTDESSGNLLVVGNGTDDVNRSAAFGILENGTQWTECTASHVAGGLQDTLMKQISKDLSQGSSVIVEAHPSTTAEALFYDYMVETDYNGGGGLPRLRSGMLTIIYHPSGTVSFTDTNSGNLNGDPLVSFTVAYNGGTNTIDLTATSTDPTYDSRLTVRKRTIK
jgi:hypothetical protein